MHTSTIRQILTALVASLSVFCAGSSYGWVTPLLVRFSKPDSPVNMTSIQSSWMVSMIEVGDFIATVPAGLAADIYGRRTILLLTAPLYIITWILVLTVKSVNILYLTRTIQGIAVGANFVVLPMYLGEIAGIQIRGALGNFLQALWYLGLIYVYSIGPFVSYNVLTTCTLIPPILFLILFWQFPETPHYLQLKNKNDEMVSSLQWLNGKHLTIDKLRRLSLTERNISNIYSHKNSEDKMKVGKNWFQLFRSRRGVKALILIHLVAMTNIVGVPAVLSYSSSTFNKMGDDSLSDQFTIIMGVMTLISAIISGILVDKIGRRPLLLFSTSFCSILLLFAAILFYIEENTDIDISKISWLSSVCIVFYPVMMSFGPGSLTYTLQAELFPDSLRGFASGLLTMDMALLSFISLKVYKILEESIGVYINYVIFSFICGFGFSGILFWIPETKGKTFAEIQCLL